MVEPQPEKTEYDLCDVCGRTMLRGERTEAYLDAGRAQKQVCMLCRPRVEHLGWISAASAGDRVEARTGPDRPRRGRRFGRSGGRRGGSPEKPARQLEDADDDDPQAEEAEAEVDAGADADDEAPAERPRRLQLGRIQMPSRRPVGGVHAVPSSPEGRFRAAVDAFNASDYSRTVSSISRSLGRPAVSVGALAGSGTDVRITVAWDLSWYQWSVDLTDPGDPVSRLGQGSEMSELDAPAREWNAHADDSGTLSYGVQQSGDE